MKSSYLNKYEKQIRLKKASALLKGKFAEKNPLDHKKEDINHSFIEAFKKAAEKRIK